MLNGRALQPTLTKADQTSPHSFMKLPENHSAIAQEPADILIIYDSVAKAL